MVGSGALFFAARPSDATLADANADLINFYSVLAHRTGQLLSRLSKLKADRNLYYALRDSRPRSALARAVRFAYLNRLCWNGVYRVNRDGHFNVPIGSRLPNRLWDEDQLRTAASALRTATLVCDDFSVTLRDCRVGDFVYLDPPYPKRSTGLGFNRYTPERFCLVDHHRLANEAAVLDRRGVYVMVSTGASRRFQSLFPRSFRPRSVRTLSLISCNGKSRGPVRETILINY